MAVRVTEGKATITYASSEGVFYNPVQVYNRDLSIACISAFITLRNNELKLKHEKRESKRADSLAAKVRK